MKEFILFLEYYHKNECTACCNVCIILFNFRWRLVIHGAVDGYSRIPVFLCCSNNNRALTVLGLFREAISTYGLPSRIRVDKGGEIYDVAMYMLDHPLRGPGRCSVIVGKSVHNQCIDCGEMSMRELLVSITLFSATWNLSKYLTRTKMCTIFPSIQSSSSESTNIFSYGKVPG